ncbi:MAG TPA: twin-arginine translocase TatA/TatE family subunit [Chloroflexota bacterium]|nr:twin-arginine translocase TatA/TatE family subunit [Chloroflexota bacterium]
MFTGGFSHAPELIILLIIALVIFGPKKLPDLGKGLGQGIKEFRKATTGEADKEEAEKDAGATAVTAASTTTPPIAEAPKASTDTTSTSPAATPPAPAAPATPAAPTAPKP